MDEVRWGIVSSAGALRFSTFGTEPVVLERADATETYAAETPPHIQQPRIQTVVDELLGQGNCPSSGESAARTSWVMDRMLEGYRDRTR
jgi:hypothetical protein